MLVVVYIMIGRFTCLLLLLFFSKFLVKKILVAVNITLACLYLFFSTFLCENEEKDIGGGVHYIGRSHWQSWVGRLAGTSPPSSRRISRIGTTHTQLCVNFFFFNLFSFFRVFFV